MKKRYDLPLLLAICLMAFACNKDITNGSTPVNNLFTDTVTALKRNEPQLLSFSDGNNTTIVKWQVSPNSNYTISTAGVYASLLFSKGGIYTVKAIANTTQATYIVTVLDSLFPDIDTGFSLEASQLVNVLPYQAVSFTVNNPLSPNNFIWTATGNISMANTSGNPALFSFGNGKTGTVKITSGSDTRSRTVWLADPTVNNPSVDTVPFIFFEKLTITPSVTTNGSGNKVLVLTANTGYNYQCYTDSVLSLVDTSNQQYTVSYGGVVMAAVPCADIKPATSVNTISKMSEGTYPFTVNFGNDTYIGSVTLSASGTYSFSWTNNDRVSIYPLVVQ